MDTEEGSNKTRNSREIDDDLSLKQNCLLDVLNVSPTNVDEKDDDDDAFLLQHLKPSFSHPKLGAPLDLFPLILPRHSMCEDEACVIIKSLLPSIDISRIINVMAFDLCTRSVLSKGLGAVLGGKNLLY